MISHVYMCVHVLSSTTHVLVLFLFESIYCIQSTVLVQEYGRVMQQLVVCLSTVHCLCVCTCVRGYGHVSVLALSVTQDVYECSSTAWLLSVVYMAAIISALVQFSCYHQCSSTVWLLPPVL